jgi:polyisoprenoid-binding protein YceI
MNINHHKEVKVMKKIPGILLAAAFLASMVSLSPVLAQNGPQTLTFSQESSITVDGTSNRDDWTVTARQFEGYVTVNESGGETIPDILEAQLIVIVQEMTGETSSIMDRLMRDALKAREHPQIVFELTGVNVEPNADDPNRFKVLTSGELSQAGVTRPIEVLLEGTRLENGTYQFTGSHSLYMRDYDMQPPTAMFGALVTGNEVTVNFDLLTERE